MKGTGKQSRFNCLYLAIWDHYVAYNPTIIVVPSELAELNHRHMVMLVIQKVSTVIFIHGINHFYSVVEFVSHLYLKIALFGMAKEYYHLANSNRAHLRS